METHQTYTPPARIVLDPGKRRVPVDKKILGHFIEHLGCCIENGIWMYDETGRALLEEAPLERVPVDLLDALKQLGIPVLRWPGGCFADTYHWRDGIGPRDARPTRRNKAWGGVKNFKYKLGPDERNHFGTGEFLALCEKLGCEALINVNYGSGTPEEAAEWVAHVGSKSNRAHIWGIANEIWGWYESGFEKRPERYASRYVEFARAMRAANPGIKLMAVGWAGHPAWNRAVLEGTRGLVDYLSIHLYFGNKPSIPFLLSVKPLPETEAFYNVEMNSTAAFESLIEQTRADIDAVLGKDGTARCKIAFDEWNVWSSLAQVYRADAPHYRLADGLWAALVLNGFIRHAEVVGMANFAQLVNAIGLVITYNDKVVLTPQYHAMRLYGEALEALTLPLVVECSDTVSSTRYSRDFPATTTPAVDAAATISNDGNRATVFVVNKHFHGRTRVAITCEGDVPIAIEGEQHVKLLAHDDPFACNTWNRPNRVYIQPHTAVVEPGQLVLDMPPHSLASVQFTVRGGW